MTSEVCGCCPELEPPFVCGLCELEARLIVKVDELSKLEVQLAELRCEGDARDLTLSHMHEQLASRNTLIFEADNNLKATIARTLELEGKLRTKLADKDIELATQNTVVEGLAEMLQKKDRRIGDLEYKLKKKGALLTRQQSRIVGSALDGHRLREAEDLLRAKDARIATLEAVLEQAGWRAYARLQRPGEPAPEPTDSRDARIDELERLAIKLGGELHDKHDRIFALQNKLSGKDAIISAAYTATRKLEDEAREEHDKLLVMQNELSALRDELKAKDDKIADLESGLLSRDSAICDLRNEAYAMQCRHRDDYPPKPQEAYDRWIKGWGSMAVPTRPAFDAGWAARGGSKPGKSAVPENVKSLCAHLDGTRIVALEEIPPGKCFVFESDFLEPVCPDTQHMVKMRILLLSGTEDGRLVGYMGEDGVLRRISALCKAIPVEFDIRLASEAKSPERCHDCGYSGSDLTEAWGLRLCLGCHQRRHLAAAVQGEPGTDDSKSKPEAEDPPELRCTRCGTLGGAKGVDLYAPQSDHKLRCLWCYLTVMDRDIAALKDAASKGDPPAKHACYDCRCEEVEMRPTGTGGYVCDPCHALRLEAMRHAAR